LTIITILLKLMAETLPDVLVPTPFTLYQYKGECGDDYDQFIKEYEEYAKKEKWKDSDKLTHLPEFTSGFARSLYLRFKLIKPDLTWNHLKTGYTSIIKEGTWSCCDQVVPRRKWRYFPCNFCESERIECFCTNTPTRT
jgi:hypothetical protein